jgi:hypothetical protein
MKNTEATPITVKQTSTNEFALVMANGMIRCYVSGTREQAQTEADRIARSIAADAAWMAR